MKTIKEIKKAYPLFFNERLMDQFAGKVYDDVVATEKGSYFISSEIFAYERISEHEIEYPEKNRVFKVNTNKRHAGRGWWKCKRIVQWPDGLIEIDAVYQNTEHRNSRTIISMRACQLYDVKSITKRVVHGKGMVPPRQ